MVSEQVAKHTGNRDGRLSEDEYLAAYRALGADQQADGTLNAQQPMLAAVRIPSAGDDSTANGTTVWTHRRNVPYVPSPLVYEGTLYLLATGGILTTIADPSSAVVSKVGRVEAAFGNCWASPVAADGKIFVLSSVRVAEGDERGAVNAPER